jgi:hypothetical protein
MEKIKRILILILQLLSLFLLVFMLSKGGIAVILGSEMAMITARIIEFGVALMSLAGIAFGLYLPTRRHRIFRDTQIHLFKYMTLLALYQLLCFFITGTFGFMGSASLLTKMPAALTNVLVLTFCLLAFMTPFNYIKQLFTVLKSVEYRDPRSLIRQLFS